AGEQPPVDAEVEVEVLGQAADAHRSAAERPQHGQPVLLVEQVALRLQSLAADLRTPLVAPDLQGQSEVLAAVGTACHGHVVKRWPEMTSTSSTPGPWAARASARCSALNPCSA